jgi:quercetin dioxygenase-like cupin family protein
VVGPRYAIVYLFGKRGEGLPMHRHDPEAEHDVMCLAGRVLVYGPSIERRVLEPGATYVFDSSIEHEVVALDDMTSVVNTFKYGMPQGYDLLPPEELAGVAKLGPVQLRL